MDGMNRVTNAVSKVLSFGSLGLNADLHLDKDDHISPLLAAAPNNKNVWK